MRTRTITAAAAAVIAATVLVGLGSVTKATATTVPAAPAAQFSISDLTGQGFGVQGPPPGIAAPGR